MGSTVCSTVAAAPDLELVAAVDPFHGGIDLSQLGVPDTRAAGRALRPRRSRMPAPTSPSTSR